MAFAEIYLRVGDAQGDAAPKDGDVVSAFTSLDIARINAEHIVRRRVRGPSGMDVYQFTNSHGTLPVGGLFWRFLAATRETLVERIADDTLRYTTLATGESRTERTSASAIDFEVYRRIAGQLPGEHQRSGPPSSATSAAGSRGSPGGHTTRRKRWRKFGRTSRT